VSGTWLTVAQVADELGVSPRTVLRWVDRGDLDAVRLPGGRLRVSQAAFAAWLAERSTTSGGRIVAAVDEGGE
jgi:excisionase family DNA binding protein